MILFVINEFNDLEQDLLKGLLKLFPTTTSRLRRIYVESFG